MAPNITEAVVTFPTSSETRTATLCGPLDEPTLVPPVVRRNVKGSTTETASFAVTTVGVAEAAKPICEIVTVGAVVTTVRNRSPSRHPRPRS